MNAEYTLAHSPYLGSQDSDGYPTGDNYGPPVDRPVFGWYPGDSQLSEDADYTRRVVQSQIVLVPDASPYSPRDKVTFPAGDEWFVTDVNDYTTGPFNTRLGGTVTVEHVIG